MSQFIEMFGNTSKEMLGKFIQVVRGVSYKPSDVKTADDPDTAVILRSNNINDANLNTDEVVYINKNRVSGDQYLRVNDIVVCASNGSKALVGKAAINKTLTNQYAHGAFCLLVRPNDNINPVYLNTFFQTSLYKKQIDELAAGSNILNIKQEYLTNMILPLPIIEEQNKFAIIAEQADKSKFGDFKSQFIEMFGDQNTNDKGWSESLVKDEFKLSMGKTPARNNPECWDNGNHKWVSISDMSSYARYTGDTSEYITDYAIADSGIKPVPKGTIIMSFKLSIGRTAITSEDIYTNEAIMAFADFDEKKFNIDFLHFLIANKNWLLGAKQAVKGQTLNKESIGNAKIIIPPIEMQEQFASIYNQADKSKSYVRIALKNLESILGYCIRQVA